MDARVAAFLLKLKSQHPIRITHQEIAAELGSSREVISCILEGFSGEGMVRIGRGVVEILDIESLRSRAAM